MWVPKSPGAPHRPSLTRPKSKPINRGPPTIQGHRCRKFDPEFRRCEPPCHCHPAGHRVLGLTSAWNACRRPLWEHLAIPTSLGWNPNAIASAMRAKGLPCEGPRGPARAPPEAPREPQETPSTAPQNSQQGPYGVPRGGPKKLRGHSKGNCSRIAYPHQPTQKQSPGDLP